MIPTLEKIEKKYGFNKPVVVADAALLSKENIESLSQARYRFIVGARIKFVAYTIYKELERLLSKHHISFSPKRTAELTQNMYELECVLPTEAFPKKILLKMDSDQQLLYDVIHANRVSH